MNGPVFKCHSKTGSQTIQKLNCFVMFSPNRDRNAQISRKPDQSVHFWYGGPFKTGHKNAQFSNVFGIQMSSF